MKVPDKILTRKDEITKEFLAILDNHINDILQGKINYMYHIKDFASLLFIHPTHFSNTIKLTTGKSPCNHVEERIIVEAKKMLDDETLPIKDICYKLTYQEPTNSLNFLKQWKALHHDNTESKKLKITPFYSVN